MEKHVPVEIRAKNVTLKEAKLSFSAICRQLQLKTHQLFAIFRTTSSEEDRWTRKSRVGVPKSYQGQMKGFDNENWQKRSIHNAREDPHRD